MCSRISLFPTTAARPVATALCRPFRSCSVIAPVSRDWSKQAPGAAEQLEKVANEPAAELIPVDGWLEQLGIADFLYLAQRTFLLEPVDERLNGRVRDALVFRQALEYLPDGAHPRFQYCCRISVSALESFVPAACLLLSRRIYSFPEYPFMNKRDSMRKPASGRCASVEELTSGAGARPLRASNEITAYSRAPARGAEAAPEWFTNALQRTVMHIASEVTSSAGCLCIRECGTSLKEYLQAVRGLMIGAQAFGLVPRPSRARSMVGRRRSRMRSASCRSSHRLVSRSN